MEELKEEEDHKLKLSIGRKSADCSEVLGTGEQSTSTEKLTGLSSEVLLSLAGWFWSLVTQQEQELRQSIQVGTQ